MKNSYVKTHKCTEAIRRIESTYPISSFLPSIVKMVDESQVILVRAETGAGKSTQIPQALLRAGYKNITITTPNRAAAITLSKRVAEELGVPLGDVVGFQTAYEKKTSHETRVLYCTDGLELIRQLYDGEGDEREVIILDEVQDWSINIEALVAFFKYKIQRGFKSKIILMSATIDETVAGFFDDAPIIRIPGRQYPIEERTGTDLAEEIVKYVKMGKNTLVFVPGMYEINQLCYTLRKMQLDADILPMHAELPLEDQEAVFCPTSRVKVVVATNIAETSITIPDIDVVIDSGLERYNAIIDGLETLTIGNTSRSSMQQRKGRAGRTKPGIYVWCGEVPIEELQEFPIPDIYTGNLSQIVLRLAYAGISASSVEFFHQPDLKKIQEAESTLRALGAFDSDNQITETGRIMALLPISVRYSRMIVEAIRRDVLEDVITIAAILECGGIKVLNVPYGNFSKEYTNDMLADLDCFNYLQKAIRTSNWPSNMDSNPFEGFNKKNYYRVMEVRTKLCDVLYKLYDDVSTSGDRKQIALSCAAGLVEHLYIHEGKGWYGSASDPCKRKLDRSSCCLLAQKYVLGIPRNISLYKRVAEAETQVLYLLSNVIVVDANMLAEIAPQFLKEEKIEYCNPLENDYRISEKRFFGENLLESTEYPITNVEERRNMAASWLAEKTMNFDEGINSNLNEILKRNSIKFENEDAARSFYTKLLRKKSKNSVPSFANPKNYHMLETDS